jgi:hypothetical protein
MDEATYYFVHATKHRRSRVYRQYNNIVEFYAGRWVKTGYYDSDNFLNQNAKEIDKEEAFKYILCT